MLYDYSPLLRERKSEMVHTFVVKGMFLVKISKQCLEPGFGITSLRVRASTQYYITIITAVNNDLNET